MPLPLVLKAVALGTAAVTGAGGLVWSATAGPTEGPAAVWVDDPLSGTSLAPGLLPILAHASSKDSLSALELLVDDKKVAEDDSLERNGLLSLGTFAWQASEGTHTLLVRTSGGGATSEPVQVMVTTQSSLPVPAPTTKVSALPTATAAPSQLSTTPSATPRPTRAAPTPTSAPYVSPTPLRTSAPPAPKPSPPASGSVSFNPSFFFWDVSPSGGPCPEPNNTVATVRVDRATSVSIVIGGASYKAIASGSTWTAQIDPSRIPGSRYTRAVPVSVVASGPGGSTSSNAGQVTITSCSKD